VFAVSLYSSTGQAAQSPACAKASAARAAKSKDFPRLQQICMAESAKPPAKSHGGPSGKLRHVNPVRPMTPAQQQPSNPRPEPARPKKKFGFPWVNVQTGGAQPARPAQP